MICLFSEESQIFKWSEFSIFLALFGKVKWSAPHIFRDFVLVTMALMVFPQLLDDNRDILWG